MRFPSRASLASTLLVGSLACGQKSPSRESGPPSLELRLNKGPQWIGNCVELSFQRTNVSKSSVFLDGTYEGVKIYSSVREASNIVGRGPREAWMLVYGWTDVVSEPIELAPGAKKRNTLCIADTFPVKQTGKETLRQVRVQSKLRIVAEYKIPTWKMIDHPDGDGRRTYVRTVDKSGHWAFSEAMLEARIPCPNGH